MQEKSRNTVLLVTQDSDLIRDVSILLSPEDFEIATASTFQEALAKIAYKVPSIILSESSIKKEDGYEFCRKIRNGIKTKLIPFIFISNSNKPEDRIRAIQERADAYMVKPVNSEELLAHIKSKIYQFNEFYLLSITDELTRLFNRREFLKKFNYEIMENNQKIISLAILDIDFFKKVNDAHGHQTGDHVLQKLAEILKNHLSETFFPTRFGGEEFVILMPEIECGKSKIIMDTIREEFLAVEFSTGKTPPFHVSFSAGISEYPSMGKNLSILLSRADQALYSAKMEGRGRCYVFSPIMAHNDRFWEYLKKNSGFFIDKKASDSVTSLPFLPQALETITNLDYEISSMGVMVIKLSPLKNIIDSYGIKDYNYAIEDIRFIISRACENRYASETFISVSNVCNYTFVILFPSISDFNLSKTKSHELYEEIITDICRKMETLPIDISFASDVIYYDKTQPRKLIHDISEIHGRAVNVTKKDSAVKSLARKIAGIKKTGYEKKKQRIITVRYYYDLVAKEKMIASLMPNIANNFIQICPIIGDIVKNIDDVKFFVSLIKKELEKIDVPLLLPYPENIRLEDYVSVIGNTFKERDIIIGINENFINTSTQIDILQATQELKPNIHLGIDNCYIGTDILNILSYFDIKYVFLSDNMTRNIHFFKDRIKVINGLKIFAEQMDIKVCSKNISIDEEIQILNDLNIDYGSGVFLDKLFS